MQRRKVQWQRLSSLIDGLAARKLSLAELQELDRLYRRASTDLARARTTYPGSEALAYLNQLCARGYQAVYQRERRPARALRELYGALFPQAFWRERPLFLLALAIFVGGALLGLFAGLAEPSSVAAVVPEGIRESVEQGELWTDHALSAATPSVLGSRIAINNLSVALTLFALGLTFGVGTAALLFFNGLHLGAVLALCFDAKLGLSLLGFVVAHGFVEIASLLLAGQAGLLLASALWAPGELSRGEALRERSRRALHLILGTAPLFLAIALVESFVSPGRLFPGPLKLALGLSLLGLLAGYLVRFGRQGASAAAPSPEATPEG